MPARGAHGSTAAGQPYPSRQRRGQQSGLLSRVRNWFGLGDEHTSAGDHSTFGAGPTHNGVAHGRAATATSPLADAPASDLVQALKQKNLSPDEYQQLVEQLGSTAVPRIARPVASRGADVGGDVASPMAAAQATPSRRTRHQVEQTSGYARLNAEAVPRSAPRVPPPQSHNTSQDVPRRRTASLTLRDWPGSGKRSTARATPQFSIKAFNSPLTPRAAQAEAFGALNESLMSGDVPGHKRSSRGDDSLDLSGSSLSMAGPPSKRRVVPSMPSGYATGALASQTAKRILDTLQKTSSPLTDASNLAKSPTPQTSFVLLERKRRRSTSRTPMAKTGEATKGRLAPPTQLLDASVAPSPAFTKRRRPAAVVAAAASQALPVATSTPSPKKAVAAAGRTLASSRLQPMAAAKAKPQDDSDDEQQQRAKRSKPVLDEDKGDQGDDQEVMVLDDDDDDDDSDNDGSEDEDDEDGDDDEDDDDDGASAPSSSATGLGFNPFGPKEPVSKATFPSFGLQAKGLETVKPTDPSKFQFSVPAGDGDKKTSPSAIQKIAQSTLNKPPASDLFETKGSSLKSKTVRRAKAQRGGQSQPEDDGGDDEAPKFPLLPAASSQPSFAFPTAVPSSDPADCGFVFREPVQMTSVSDLNSHECNEEFTFGAGVVLDGTSKDSAAAPSSFGLPTQNEGDPKPSPFAGFGAAATKEADKDGDSKPSPFAGFGAAATKEADKDKDGDSKPSPFAGFGADKAAESKPAPFASFGAAKDTESKPAFQFGAASDAKAEPAAAAAAPFGGASSKPAGDASPKFPTFGATTTPAPAGADGAKPFAGFGSLAPATAGSTTPAPTAKPAEGGDLPPTLSVEMAGSPVTTSASTGFQFGQPTAPTTAAPSTSTTAPFQFGGASAAGGGSAAPTAAAAGQAPFQFGGTSAAAPSTAGTPASSASAAPAAFGAAPAAFGAAPAAFGGAAPAAFGGAAAAASGAKPPAAFGAPVTGPSGGGFGTPEVPKTFAFGAGGAPAPAAPGSAPAPTAAAFQFGTNTPSSSAAATSGASAPFQFGGAAAPGGGAAGGQPAATASPFGGPPTGGAAPSPFQFGSASGAGAPAAFGGASSGAPAAFGGGSGAPAAFGSANPGAPAAFGSANPGAPAAFGASPAAFGGGGGGAPAFGSPGPAAFGGGAPGAAAPGANNAAAAQAFGIPTTGKHMAGRRIARATRRTRKQ